MQNKRVGLKTLVGAVVALACLLGSRALPYDEGGCVSTSSGCSDPFGACRLSGGSCKTSPFGGCACLTSLGPAGLTTACGSTGGAYVDSVLSGGPADKAGVKSGDVIRTINGRTVEDPNQFKAMVTHIRPGTEVGLKILRNGAPMTLRLTLGEPTTNLATTAATNAAAH